MSDFSVEQLVSTFKTAGADSRLELDAAFCKASGIGVVSVGSSFYIEPTLRSDKDETTNPVLLISAPAAVGKTRLAETLVTRLGNKERLALHIPLQGFTIGDKFFAGLLGELFPRNSQQEILDTVFSGRLILVFDGYDEVSLTEPQLLRNKIFINEVAEECGRQKANSPCIVFLFRSVFFQFGIFDAIIPHSRSIAVDFFNKTQQSAYLQAHLKKHDPAFANKLKLVARFVEAFEKHLATANSESGSFFGHAIVLSAFGDYLLNVDEENSIALANQLETMPVSEGTSAKLLQEVITRILAREVEKFPKGTLQQSLPSFVGYPIELQEALLGAIARDSRPANQRTLLQDNTALVADRLLLKDQTYSKLTHGQRDSVREQYLQELANKFRLHPFLEDGVDGSLHFRNPIYREYYLARHLATADAEFDIPLREPGFKASHYLALFFLAHLPDRDISSRRGCSIFYVTRLLASADSGDAGTEITWEAGDQRWSISVDTDALAHEPFFYPGSLLLLEVPHEGDLVNLSIEVEDGDEMETAVCIAGPRGSTDQESRIKLSSVTVTANELELDVVRADLSDVYLCCNVLRLAERMARIQGVESVTACAEHELQVVASEFMMSAGAAQIGEQHPIRELGGFIALLQTMVLRFRKHGRSEFAMYDKKFETHFLRKGGDHEAVALSNFLFAEGMLTRPETGLIALDQARLGSYGVYYTKQNQIEVQEEKLRPLFEAFVASVED